MKNASILQKCLLQDTDTYRNFKEAFTENYVFTQLLMLGIKPYFWRSGNTAEVDFIYEEGEKIIPLEVKADLHTRAKSYQQYCKKYHPGIGFKLSLKNVGCHQTEETHTVSLPLYMIGRIGEYTAT